MLSTSWMMEPNFHFVLCLLLDSFVHIVFTVVYRKELPKFEEVTNSILYGSKEVGSRERGQ